jgi:hypothetical protein
LHSDHGNSSILNARLAACLPFHNFRNGAYGGDGNNRGDHHG